MRLSKSHSVSLKRRVQESLPLGPASPKRQVVVLRSKILNPGPSVHHAIDASFHVSSIKPEIDSSSFRTKSSPKFRRTKTKVSPKNRDFNETQSANRLKGNFATRTRGFGPRDPYSFETILNVTGITPTKGLTPKALTNVSFSPRHNRAGVGLPSTGRTAGKTYDRELTDYEKTEVQTMKEIFYLGQFSAKHIPTSPDDNFGFDDPRGDYIVTPGDHLYYRYQVVSMLGKGSFGQVCKCMDHKTKSMTAVKIIRNKKRLYTQGLVEVNALETLRNFDPEDRKFIVRIRANFTFRNHLCIVFELLSYNLYELLKSRSFQGLPLPVIRKVGEQLLTALEFTRRNKVIHCDLKPENVMIRKQTTPDLKLIDFGSCCFSDSRVYTYIQSRFYRAPEVILGIPYTTQIDIWSLGCILAELFTGTPIFAGENEQEQIMCMMEVAGTPSMHVLQTGVRWRLFFDESGTPKLAPNKRGKILVPGSKPLSKALMCEDELFIDFLRLSFQWDPITRLTPEQGLLHPWVTRC